MVYVCVCMCIFIYMYVCLRVCGNTCVHMRAHMWVYLTAQVFSAAVVFFVKLPQASHCCSPVRQVLMTGSVNINKTSTPSVTAPIAALLAAMQMQVLHKLPVMPRAGWPSGLPACRQVNTVWPSLVSAVCTQ